VVKPRVELLRLKALKALYEKAEDGRVYGWNKIMEIIVGCGVSEPYARVLVWDFYLLGLLERPRVGLYKVNKDRIKAYIEEYEAKLAKLRARRGGSGGPAHSQG
jgi:hypothetical protein